MKLDKTKTTVITIVVLIVVCAGSFFGVKTLNNKTTVPHQPLTVTSPSVSTTYPTTQSTTAPTTTTTVPSTTAPTTTASTTTTTSAPSTTQTTTETTTRAVLPSSWMGTTSKSQSASVVATTHKVTDEEAQKVINSASKESKGFLGYLFDSNGQYYYTSSDPWQRNFGFNEIYDVGAAFVNFYLDTLRCKFTVDDTDYMIQFWKGQYGFVFIGAEIGIYYKPAERNVEHYDCVSDNDALYMSMTLYRKGEEKLTREYAKYWWCTGFIPGMLDSFKDRSELTLNSRITMKNYKMLFGYCKALKENGYEMDKDFTTSGLDVYFTWK